MTDRKLLSITTRKLAYYKQRLEDLRECEKANLSKDATIFCRDEIVKAKNNIEYYKNLKEILTKE